MNAYMLFKRLIISKILFMFLLANSNIMLGQEVLKSDLIKTKSGNIEISFIGHGSLMFRLNEKIIHIDPFSKLTDYSKLPKADLILITHQHGDHLDLNAIKSISKGSTQIIMTSKCKESADSLINTIIMKNGDKQKIIDIDIEAVPAYNLINKGDNGDFFHPKGEGNGYVLTINRKRIYIAGDTENTPEMKALKNIDIAFLPMNLPYTMTPEMVADAVKAFRPKIFYPYHFGDTETQKLLDLLQDTRGVEVRIREMK
jgi:L-ascorbate metabolism protein UlaG (beta-lactamase superfamily)